MIENRYSVRAIVLTPEPEILLMQIRAPQGGDPLWITPGGGLEDGEDAEAGLRRELREELGLEAFERGPLLWRRRSTFSWGDRRICQDEEYRAVHVARFEPLMSDEVEVKALEQFRWWPVAALATTDQRLIPLSLHEIVRSYLADGPPREPPPVEVVVD